MGEAQRGCGGTRPLAKQRNLAERNLESFDRAA
jgi:hypothetical protein